MSELVETLTKLAKENVYDEHGIWIGIQFSQSKFAKLLINHCAVTARDVANECAPDDSALDRCYEIENAIRQLAVDL